MGPWARMRAARPATRRAARQPSALGLIAASHASGGTYAPGTSSVQLDGDELRHAGLLHCHTVQPVRNLHRLAIVGDEDELGVVQHGTEHLDESTDVGVVEGG